MCAYNGYTQWLLCSIDSKVGITTTFEPGIQEFLTREQEPKVEVKPPPHQKAHDK